METLEIKPSLNQLHDFIAKIADYPVSVRKLIKQARKIGASKEIIEFYGRFADDQVFKNKTELKGRSEQVGIMRSERPGMPRESMTASEED